jgi:hypothetical protein
VQVIDEQHVGADCAFDQRGDCNGITGQPALYGTPQREVRHPAEGSEAAAFEQSATGVSGGRANERRFADPSLAQDCSRSIAPDRSDNSGLLHVASD